MSFVSNYPLIYLPATIEANLAYRSRRSTFKKKLEIQPEFVAVPKVKTDLLPVKKIICFLRYTGWLFSGIISVSLVSNLIDGASFWELLPGVMLLLFKTFLVTGTIYGLQQLGRSQQADLARQQELYWQQNQKQNQNLYRQYPDLIRQEFLTANPQLKLNSILAKEPLHNHTFERGIVKEEAQKGVSEAHFQSFLVKYFPDCQFRCDYFALNDKIGYTTDFSLITADGRLAIDIEIDEPYEGKSKTPHHCTDNNKDRNRNLYFNERGWVVIRLSEYQVVRHPESCCLLIARLLDKLGYDTYLPPLSVFAELPHDSTWTTASAKMMVSRKYREIYLDKAGLFKYDRARERRNAKQNGRANKVKKRVTKPKYRLKPSKLR